MKKVFKYRRMFFLGLTPLSLILILFAKQSSFFAEQIYAKHIYKFISQIISTISGVLPFSLAEILTIAIPIAILIILVRFIILMVVDKANRRDRLMKGLFNILCVTSMMLFLFTLLTGLNYYRDSFSSYANLELRNSSVTELYELTKTLTLSANELRSQIPQTDEEGVFQLSMSCNKLAEITANAFNLLAEDYPILGGYYGAAKPIYLSKLMSQTEITGVFIPFTMEANVNVDVPDYTIPATMLHELAHLRGFMREDEANFLAYLSGMKSDHVEVQYSSTMQALILAGNTLYEQDKDLYFQIRELYSEGVIKDIRANTRYWIQYEDTVISTMSNRINDTYLKANSQMDGVKSYGRMLDLLLAKYRKDQE